MDMIYSRPMHPILSFYFTVVRKYHSHAKNWKTSAQSLVIEVSCCMNVKRVSSLTNAENWDNMEAYHVMNSIGCE